ncbi:MAG: GNAT family N-acetyltransferase [Armatimonadetes bacterium]|nr:GNAT family N-acetyltransferase [Armatimonadota bacterium]MDE2207365.1 GNAT family N-acetyltransferase [Armatimonadota bacterium]
MEHDGESSGDAMLLAAILNHRSMEEANRCVARLAATEFRGDADGLSWFASRIASPVANMVVRTRLGGPPREGAIENLLDTYRKLGSPIAWLVGPASTPGNLDKELEAHGLINQTQLPLMNIDLEKYSSTATPAGVTISEVETDSELATFTDIAAEAFECPRGAIALWSDAGMRMPRDGEVRARMFLASLDGVPVATAQLAVALGVAGVYAVSTLPKARGRGLGTAVTWAALTAGREMGCRVGTLQASPMGKPVYHRMGFVEVGAISLFGFGGG